MQPPNKKNGDPNGSLNFRMFFFSNNYSAAGAMKAYSFAACVRLGIRLGIFFTFPRKALLEDGTNKLFEASRRNIEKNIQTCQISGSLNGALVVEVICIFYCLGGMRRQKSKYLLVTGVLFIKGSKLPTNHWLIHALRKNKLKKKKKTYVWVEPSQV